MDLFKLIYRPLTRRAALAVLRGRNRDRGRPEKGRFSGHDAQRVMQRTWEEFDTLIPTMPALKTAGGRRNVRLGVFTLALYRALRTEVEDRAYATELTADFCWHGYEMSLAFTRFIARLRSRDPRKQMDFMMRAGLRYPFSRPDYDWNVRPDPDAFAVDFHRCPVHDYFRSQGDEALELFRNTWCTMDFPIAEAMVEGGRYERPHTLSYGDGVCDMRWIVD